ncbi:MAG: tetratricopeptide repeat protein [Cytophagales bacterium]|nr:tetratricopeptide repeat protein [Bernardetiaceae bacterium]MDW8205170.1 tetratricopeptide repeat protein [Cytophagales bacterium]
MYRLLFAASIIIFCTSFSYAQPDLTYWQKQAVEARKMLTSKPQEVLKIAEQYLQIASTGMNAWSYADAQYLMGQYHLVSGNYATALKILQQTINYLNAKNNPSDSLLTLKANVSQAMGSIYQIWGMWAESLEAYTNALAIDRAQQNNYGIARTLNNMSVLFERMDDTLQAISHAQQALEIAEKYDYKQLQAAALGNMAIAYKNQGQYQKALQLQMRSLQIKRQINDLRGVANSLGNIGIIYAEQKKYPEALLSTHQALAIYQQLGDAALIAQGMEGIGKMHLDNNRLDSAAYYLEQALPLAISRNFSKVVYACYEDLSTLAQYRNNLQKALEYHLLADSVNRILFNHEKQQLAEQAKARYDWQQQQLELQRLDWEAKVQKIDNERKAKIIELLRKDAEAQKRIAEAKQLELSLLVSEKKLLEQERLHAAQQIREQQMELELEKTKRKQNELAISLKEKQVTYTRDLNFALLIIFLLITLLLYMLFRRVRQKLFANKTRHMQAMDEIAHINSHKMRAPVATALGLINLIKMESAQGNHDPVLIELLDKTLQEMDKVVREVSQITYRLTDEQKE